MADLDVLEQETVLWAVPRDLAAPPARPVQTILQYDPADPWAVTLRMVLPERDVLWTFARQLLADGLQRRVGDGDVRVTPWAQPGRRMVAMTLFSPDGDSVDLISSRTPLAQFLRNTYRLVPRGTEAAWVDWDATVHALLGGGEVR